MTSRRPCLRTWWPDQLVGFVLAVHGFWALTFGGEAALHGVGLSGIVGNAAMVVWFAGLLAAGVIIGVATECDRPRTTAVALAFAGLLLAANAVTTLGPKGDSALGASIAYTVAAIYLWRRAQDAYLVALGRDDAHRVLAARS